MKKLYHKGIYYPDSKEEMETLLGSVSPDKSAKALILPHQSLRRCFPLLQEGFRHTLGKDRVIILSPLHSGRITSSAFAEGEVLPSSNMVTLGLETVEAYAEEEPGAEIIVPFVEKYMPSSSWSVIYADIKNASESKRLAAFLREIDTPSTLFIVSTNLSPLSLTKDECEEWRERAKSLLLSSDSVLDSVNRHTVSFCGAGIIDSLDRVIKGKWKWIMDEESDSTTAHSLLTKEESDD